VTEKSDLDRPISLECHKLMFAMAAWAATKFFSDVPDDQIIQWCAMFELSKDQTAAASKEFAQLCLAFRDDRNRVMAEWLRKRH
jgi:hypothetical protein